MYSVAEQIYVTDIQKIPRIVWAESASFIVPVYSLVYCLPPNEINLLVNTALVLFSWSLYSRAIKCPSIDKLTPPPPPGHFTVPLI